MGREHEPKVGQWYGNLEDNDSFRVVSIDDDAELVEIEYVDGDVEELDIEAWHELDLDPTVEPEGWSGEDDDEDDDEDDWEEDEDEDEDEDDWDEDEDEDEDEDDWDDEDEADEGHGHRSDY